MTDQSRSEQLLTLGIILGALAVSFAAAVAARAGVPDDRPAPAAASADDPAGVATGEAARP